jgi:SAM-dependent methyltransferase
MSSVRKPNINNEFFDGHYKDIWRAIIPEALTKGETDFLVQEAQLQPESKVLDLMCGYGRHALALARKGIEVVAVDNLADYVNEIDDVIKKENLPIQTVKVDAIEFQPHAQFDLAICMGNSLSIFDRDDTVKLFSTIASCLKPNCKFIFSTWMIAEIAIKQFKERSWSYVGDLKCLSDSRYFFSPSRIETEMTIIASNGTTEVKQSLDYIYSVDETENMLRKSGLAMKEVWSVPQKKKFTLGEPRAYIVAEKK